MSFWFQQKIHLYLFFFLLSLLFISCKSKSKINTKNINDNYISFDTSAYYKVLKIIDGDTFLMGINEHVSKVRLIGVDAPESTNNPKTKSDAHELNLNTADIIEMGSQSKAFVSQLLSLSDSVKTEFDVQKKDRYGRLLLYMYLCDGRMLNEVLVSEGYAQVMTIPPNVKYQDLFLKAELFARENKKGLWNN